MKLATKNLPNSTAFSLCRFLCSQVNEVDKETKKHRGFADFGSCPSRFLTVFSQVNYKQPRPCTSAAYVFRQQQ